MDEEHGRKLGTLVLNSGRWVHRRVDTVTFNPDGRMHRRISFDLTVPRGLSVLASAARVIVPLGLMEKRTSLSGFAAEDPGRGAIPVLGAEEGMRLSAEMVRSLTGQFAGSGGTEHLAVVERILCLPADCSEGEKNAALGTWEAWRRAVEAAESRNDEGSPGRLGELDALVRALVENTVLFVEVDGSCVGSRCIVKVAFDTEAEISCSLGRVQAVRFTVPGLGFAQSQHLQVEVPFGLAVGELAVAETLNGALLGSAAEAPVGVRTGAHVHITPTALTSCAEVAVKVKAARGGIFSSTCFAVAGVAALAALSVAERTHLIHVLAGPVPVPSLSLSLLFGAIAVGLLWSARPPEHRIVARVQAPLRWILRLCAAALVVIGLTVTFPVPAWAWESAWDCITAAALAGILAFGIHTMNLLGRICSLSRPRP